jgi:hypothetical protein
MAGKVKSGVDHMLKSMLGVDVEELTQFGNQVGQLLVDFRDSLIRIEERLGRIERVLRIEQTGGRIIAVVDPPSSPGRRDE